MKNILFAVLMAVMVVGCGKSKDSADDKQGDKASTSAKKAAPVKPITLTEVVDLGAAIKDPDDKNYEGLKVKAWKGAKAAPGLVGVTVAMGEKMYELSGNYSDSFVAEEKAKAEKDTLDKLVKFHIDKPAAILFESKSELGGTNNFHFSAEMAIGDKKYKCFNKGYGQFTLAEAQAMLKSCQSLSK